MKKNYLNLFLSAVALLCCMVASAHDFEVDGIFYNITDESAKTVEVTFKGDKYDSYTSEYVGEVVVPEIVEYHGYTYTVTAIGEYTFYNCRFKFGIVEILQLFHGQLVIAVGTFADTVADDGDPVGDRFDLFQLM